MSKFNKKKFLKYRLIPLVVFSIATLLFVMFAAVIIDAKSISISLGIVMILTLITIWSVAIDSNNDAHSREIKDILKKLLPEEEEKNE